MDSHKRTTIKSISWRIIATVVTMIMSYIWFKDVWASVGFGIAANAIKFLAYYGHERLWNRVRWGLQETKIFRDNKFIIPQENFEKRQTVHLSPKKY